MELEHLNCASCVVLRLMILFAKPKDTIFTRQTNKKKLRKRLRVKNFYLIILFLLKYLNLFILGKRLSPKNKKILSKWFKKNKFNPYLNKNETKILCERTQLSSKKIATWLSNKRKMRKKKLKITSNAAREILKNFFDKKQFANDVEIQELSAMTNYPPRKILNFFRNKRYSLKHKKMNKN